MYQEERKRAFMQEYVNSQPKRLHAVTLFRLTQPFEEEYQADLCQFTKGQMQTAIQTIHSVKVVSRWSRFDALRAYLQYCLDHGVPGASNALDGVEVDGLEKARNQMLAGPEDLNALLDAMCAPVEDCATDCVYRAFYWLLYGGLSPEEAVEIRSNQVDLENLRVYGRQAVCYLYAEGLPAIRTVMQARELTVYHSLYTTSLPRQAGDQILRLPRRALNDLEYRNMSARLNRDALRAGRTEKKVTATAVQNSGLFYRVWQSVLPEDFYEEAYRAVSESNQPFADAAARTNAIRSHIKKYTEAYYLWKAAFQR